MKLEGERQILATVDRTWVALNDPGILKACIPGCESLEVTGENTFSAVAKIKIGPVNAKFKSNLTLENVVPLKSYTIRFEGKGGVAGFGKGTADVNLEAHDGGTLLKYVANAQVGGKIAQVGSRLVDMAAAKISEDFFKKFEAQLSTPSADSHSEVSATAPTDGAAPASAGAASSTGKPQDSANPPSKGMLPWILGAAVIIAGAVLLCL